MRWNNILCSWLRRTESHPPDDLKLISFRCGGDTAVRRRRVTFSPLKLAKNTFFCVVKMIFNTINIRKIVDTYGKIAFQIIGISFIIKAVLRLR